MVLGVALGVWFMVLAVRRGQIVTPAWMYWVAARFRRRQPDPLEPVPASETATPSSVA